MGTDLHIETNSYTSDYQFISPDLVMFRRRHKFQSAMSLIEAYGAFWNLALIDLKPSQVAARRMGQEIPLAGRLTVFGPNFSLIDWRVNAGDMNWSCYASTASLPKDLPTEPMAYHGWPPTEFKTPDEIFNFLMGAEPYSPIGKIEFFSPLAQRIKQKIDDHFILEERISDIACQLQVSPAAMARAFKKSFGLTPVAYRNKMRIFRAMTLLLNSKDDITDTCFEVGFTDVSRFYKQFRKQLNATPRQYQRKSHDSSDGHR